MGRVLWKLSLEQWRGTGSHDKNDNVSFTSLAKDVCSDVPADDIKQHKWLVSAVDWNSSSSLCSLWWLSILILSEWGMKYIHRLYTVRLLLRYLRYLWCKHLCLLLLCIFSCVSIMQSKKHWKRREQVCWSRSFLFFFFLKEWVPHCLSRGKHNIEAHFHLQQGRDQLKRCKWGGFESDPKLLIFAEQSCG